MNRKGERHTIALLVSAFVLSASRQVSDVEMSIHFWDLDGLAVRMRRIGLGNRLCSNARLLCLGGVLLGLL